ncbi:MAG TPA: TlpA disulfide reductase family protein, partial [Pirellulaceae bacterium]|nr:TlpA disulfide reductase family protein [Pirellulaceae bacterium]
MNLRFAMAGLSLLIVAGCDTSAPSPEVSGENSGPTAPAVAHGPKLPLEQVNLVVGDEKKFAELIAAHKGSVVLIDYWATWCGPCVEGFPHTVELSQKHKEPGLATIAVSFDLLEDEQKVREFLADQGASFENVLSKYDGVNQEAAEG